MTNDVLLIAALRLIQAWDSDAIVKGGPKFLGAVYDLRKAVAIYQPDDRDAVNSSLRTFRLTNTGT